MNSLKKASGNFEVKINKQYEEKEQFLSFSSSLRDSSVYPSVNSYKIKFTSAFKNVQKIELVQAIIPSQNNVLQQGVLLLQIKNIPEETTFFETVPDTFCSLLMKTPTSGGFIALEPGCGFSKFEKKFTAPIGKLAQFDINILKTDGTPFSFGEPSGDKTKPYENFFVFKITTKEVMNTIESHF
jgi:hypothetical protein